MNASTSKSLDDVGGTPREAVSAARWHAMTHELDQLVRPMDHLSSTQKRALKQQVLSYMEQFIHVMDHDLRGGAIDITELAALFGAKLQAPSSTVH